MASLALVAVMVLTVALAVLRIQPPAALPDSAPAAQFSAGRALRHVQAIAHGPHMGGSPEQAKVREYLVRELEALGLEATIQSTATASRGSFAAYVDNVIARIPGQASTKAVLMMAHYDAVPFVPGASDNAASVATVLETIRTLKHRAPLKNHVIVLLCDSEELYHQGSMAFVQESPLVKDIGFVMNFDAAGSSGPAFLLRTTSSNGWVVREFARAAHPRFAGSVFDEIFRRLPLGTDFDSITDTAMSGLDLVRAGSLVTYHTDRDDLAHLDLRSIQDLGVMTLATLVHFGNLDLNATKASDVVYFSFPFPSCIVYPVSWRFVLAVLATLVLGYAFVLAKKMGRIRLGKLLLGSLALVLRMVAAGAAAQLLWKGLSATRPESGLFFMGAVYHAPWYLAGFIALGIAVGIAG